MNTKFTTDCRLCPRLATFLDQVRLQSPEYYAKPVVAFGDENPRLLIVGLAPGMHGANKTGRPFTGDFAGILLYETLHRFGFSTKPVSTHAQDGLALTGCRITNAVKCLPPQNKPELSEIKQCNKYLKQEIEVINKDSAILALGTVAHKSVLMALDLKEKNFPFSHGAQHTLPSGQMLFDSYHCSRYNTQTRRLTPQMFYSVFTTITHYLEKK